MFGYVTINSDEMKLREYRRYHSYYCGVCKSLQHQYGPVAQMTLTYDMSFLGLLLTSLYEDETKPKKIHCIAHPMSSHEALTNVYTEYAAAINVMLAYYKCDDDWKDEKKLHKKGLATALKRSFRKAKRQYPKQAQAIEEYIRKQTEIEKRDDATLDEIAGITGEMLGTVFAMKEDAWQPQLYRMGYFMGKFIYIMDAYDDLQKDEKKHNYNPLLSIKDEADFDEQVRSMLTIVAAESSRAFESLPILMDADIVRNIIYSGMWMKFDRILFERHKLLTN